MNNESFLVNNYKRTEMRKMLRKNQTPQEAMLWAKLRGKQTGRKWRRQVSIGGYIVDFYCTEKKLVIEIDGSQHEDAKEYDLEREKYLECLGIKTIRFWNNEVNTNIDGVLVKIINTLAKTPSQPSPAKGKESYTAHH